VIDLVKFLRNLETSNALLAIVSPYQIIPSRV